MAPTLPPEGQRLTNALARATYLRTVQDWIIRPQLKNIEGVAGVDAIGGYVKQYHVQPDPMQLVAYGLTFQEVIEALERNNVSTGAGYIEHKGEAYIVRADGRIANEEQIASIVVGTRQGTPIYIRDVATVGLGRELRTGGASENGAEVVVGTALMLLGENSRTVAAAVDAKMRDISKSLPPHIQVKTVLNRSKLVNATIKTVQKNLAEGAFLVIAVLFLLLGNLRAALITALAIPLSMLMTAIGMVRAGVSGNLMSLGALDFGLIVDGAVIIVENCLRHLAERQHALGRLLTTRERLHEVWVATREMIQPSVFGQAIIITVYLPILSLTGIEGKMFTPMAMTVIFALVAAFVLSLTFVPAMVALCIRGRVTEQENVLVRLAKWAYAPVLRLALRLRYVVVPWRWPPLSAPCCSLGPWGRSSSRRWTSRTLRHSRHADSQHGADAIAPDAVAGRKDAQRVSGGGLGVFQNGHGGNGFRPHAAERLRHLYHPQAPRPVAQSSRAEKRPDPAYGRSPRGVPGHNYEFTQPIQMRFNELISGVRSDVAVKVYGDDFDAMQTTAAAIAQVLQSVPGAADVKVEQTTGLPILSVLIDRAAIARYGLNVADVQDVVAIAMGGREAGLVFEGDRRFPLMVRLPEACARISTPWPRCASPCRIRRTAASLCAPPPCGPPPPPQTVRPTFPLGEVARFEVAEGPNQISRENGKRRIVVQANIRGRDLGSFVADAQQQIAAQVPLPPGSWLDWGGQFENLVAARQRLSLVVPLCFFLIFLLLFSAFNSVKYALLVFTGVPLALTGGILSLWLRDMPFSISAAVGFIALSGVAVLNGLVMVTYINQLRLRGAARDEAIVQGAMTRLRPVLMTALVASLGFVPMALATGTGAEVQKPLATVVIGGLVSSTLLTLVVLPALYRIFAREHDLTESHAEDITQEPQVETSCGPTAYVLEAAGECVGGGANAGKRKRMRCRAPCWPMVALLVWPIVQGRKEPQGRAILIVNPAMLRGVRLVYAETFTLDNGLLGYWSSFPGLPHFSYCLVQIGGADDPPKRVRPGAPPGTSHIQGGHFRRDTPPSSTLAAMA